MLWPQIVSPRPPSPPRMRQKGWNWVLKSFTLWLVIWPYRNFYLEGTLEILELLKKKKPERGAIILWECDKWLCVISEDKLSWAGSSRINSSAYKIQVWETDTVSVTHYLNWLLVLDNSLPPCQSVAIRPWFCWKALQGKKKPSRNGQLKNVRILPRGRASRDKRPNPIPTQLPKGNIPRPELQKPIHLQQAPGW